MPCKTLTLNSGLNIGDTEKLKEYFFLENLISVTIKVIIPAVAKGSRPEIKGLEELPTPEAKISAEPQLLNRYQSHVAQPHYTYRQPVQLPNPVNQHQSQGLPPQLNNPYHSNPVRAPNVHFQSHTSNPQWSYQQPISGPSNLESRLLDQMQNDEPQVFHELQAGLEPMSKEVVLQRLQRSLSNIYSMPSEYLTLATQYIKNMDQVYQDTFLLGGNPNMEKITSFGISLLHQFANDKKPIYLPIVEHLITKIDDKLPEGIDLVELPTTWNQKYYFFCVRLTRMLAMFEILGNKESIKTICHKRICQITPYLWKSLNWMMMWGIELAWIAIPRLVTNFLNETETYKKETKLDPMNKLREILKAKFLGNIDVVVDGLWVEKSCVFHGVATYWPIVESGQFYASVFRALGYEADIDDVTQKILSEILHPSMDIIPLGLFGRQPDIRIKKTLETNWPQYQQKAKLDVGIFPVAGLGVFKSRDFAFWVRVQRWYLAGYECDQVNFELAGGWIQMRKLYLTSAKNNYRNMTWQEIKMQPGVISNEDGSDDFEHLKPHKEEAYHYPKDVISHIGTLMDEKNRVLYWKNKYKFVSLFGESEITEFGVCTDNGLVMRMEVLNRTGKTLKVRVKDDDATGMLFDCRCSGPAQNCDDGFVIVGNGDKIDINWRQVFNRDTYPQEVTRVTAGGHMTFKFGELEVFDYVIESQDALHFVIKNSEVILAGSFEKSLSYTIQYGYKNEPILFKLNPHTLMYTAIR
uniref:Uncharacterized protein n=1 Tax=Glyptapanteles indiensis TaxID=92994 RepID=B7S913_GLYIN|nr:hypothetical protein GIP_L8_0020 [Glyptapanteles indiensis]